VVYFSGKVSRTDAFDTYAPHYDRRHHVNFVGSHVFGKNKSLTIDTRWNFGSAFPFTKTQGYYESLTFEDGIAQM